MLVWMAVRLEFFFSDQKNRSKVRQHRWHGGPLVTSPIGGQAQILPACALQASSNHAKSNVATVSSSSRLAWPTGEWLFQAGLLLGPLDTPGIRGRDLGAAIHDSRQVLLILA